MLCYEGKESTAMKDLFRVLNDHKNPMIQKLVNDAYEKCFQLEMESSFDYFEVNGDCSTDNVVRCCLIKLSYSSMLQEAIAKLLDAKLMIDLFGFHDENQGTTKVDDDAQQLDQLTVLINNTGIAMKKLEYALFRAKEFTIRNLKQSAHTPTNARSNCLVANESFKERLFKNTMRVIDDWKILTQGATQQPV